MNEQRKVLMDVDALPIHKQLRIRRLYDHLTQTQLSDVLGISDVSKYCRWETGLKPIPKRYMARIKQYLYEDVITND